MCSERNPGVGRACSSLLGWFDSLAPGAVWLLGGGTVSPADGALSAACPIGPDAISDAATRNADKARISGLQPQRENIVIAFEAAHSLKRRPKMRSAL